MNMMERLYTPTTKLELHPTTLIAPVRIIETRRYTESLSSYITRLAQAHQLSVGLLFTQFIQPRISSQQKGHLLHRCTDGYAINGAGYLGGDIYNAAKSMVSPLESDTFCSFYFLTSQTLAILDVIHPISGHREYLFHRNPNSHANSQSANIALKRMGFAGELVSHGLRALASTTLNEQSFDPVVIESALAHVDKNEVRRAYNRA